jgi:hypothetical protein
VTSGDDGVVECDVTRRRGGMRSWYGGLLGGGGG